MLSITGMDKVSILLALYENAESQGIASIVETPPTYEEAKEAINTSRSGRIDFFNGRAIRVQLRGRTLDPTMYDRANGEGACASAIYDAAPVQEEAPQEDQAEAPAAESMSLMDSVKTSMFRKN